MLSTSSCISFVVCLIVENVFIEVAAYDPYSQDYLWLLLLLIVEFFAYIRIFIYILDTNSSNMIEDIFPIP